MAQASVGKKKKKKPKPSLKNNQSKRELKAQPKRESTCLASTRL
jgi:hypothetical protein